MLTVITAIANYHLFTEIPQCFIYILKSLISCGALLLAKNIASKVTGGIVPVVVPANDQDTALIPPVVVWLSHQPVIIIPVCLVRPSEVGAVLPRPLAPQPEPVVVRQLRHELILLPRVD